MPCHNRQMCIIKRNKGNKNRCIIGGVFWAGSAVHRLHVSLDTERLWYLPTSSSILGMSSGMRNGLEITSSYTKKVVSDMVKKTAIYLQER